MEGPSPRNHLQRSRYLGLISTAGDRLSSLAPPPHLIHLRLLRHHALPDLGQELARQRCAAAGSAAVQPRNQLPCYTVAVERREDPSTAAQVQRLNHALRRFRALRLVVARRQGDSTSLGFAAERAATLLMLDEAIGASEELLALLEAVP